MTLKGNLKEFSFIQLLNLINLAKKSGALYIDRPGETARVIFRNGKVAYADSAEEKRSLLDMLAEARLITAAQTTLLSERLNSMNEKAAGIYMVCAGYASQDQIFTAMQNKFYETIRKLFSWDDGFFHYEPGELTPDGCIPVNMNLENLIVEGSRRQHELEELEAEIPSLEMALKFTDRPGTEMNNINLSVEEWRVINYINPKNSIQQIADAVQMSELEIRRVVYTLLQAGLVEIVRPGGLPLRLPGKMFPTQNPDEQISLVNRLIHRIRSI